MSEISGNLCETPQDPLYLYNEILVLIHVKVNMVASSFLTEMVLSYLKSYFTIDCIMITDFRLECTSNPNLKFLKSQFHV